MEFPKLKKLYDDNEYIAYAKAFITDPYLLLCSQEKEMEVETMAILRSYLNSNNSQEQKVAYQDFVEDELMEESVPKCMDFIKGFIEHYYIIKTSKHAVQTTAIKALIKRCMTEFQDEGIQHSYGDDIASIQVFRCLLLKKPDSIFFDSKGRMVERPLRRTD